MVPGLHTAPTGPGIILHFILGHPSTLLATPASELLPGVVTAEHAVRRRHCDGSLGSTLRNLLGGGTWSRKRSKVLLRSVSRMSFGFPSLPRDLIRRSDVLGVPGFWQLREATCATPDGSSRHPPDVTECR